MNERRRRSELDDAVARRRARRSVWDRDGERSLASNLALVGTLGWLVATPLLVGLFVGRWLDRVASTGVTFASALMFLGLIAGCYLAWKKVQSA